MIFSLSELQTHKSPAAETCKQHTYIPDPTFYSGCIKNKKEEKWEQMFKDLFKGNIITICNLQSY